MLRFDEAAFVRIEDEMAAAFAEELRGRLAAAHPGFLPRFPAAAQRRIVSNLTARATALGLTWRSGLMLHADLALAFGGGFTARAAFREALAQAPGAPDEAFPRAVEALDEGAWREIAGARSELPVYAPPSLDEAPVAARATAALAILLWDRPVADLPALAAGGVEEAAEPRWAGAEDAPHVLAGFAALAGRRFAGLSSAWAEDVRAPGVSARTATAMLRARAMIDFGRRL